MVDSTPSDVSDAPEARRPGKGGRPRELEHDTIVDVAMAIVDEDDLPGLTMRKLGARLGVDAATIYSYFPSRAALLAAVVERVGAKLRPVPPGPSDPYEFLVHAALHYRRVLLEHPHLAPLVAARPLPQENWITAVPVAVEMFRGMGTHEDLLPQASEVAVLFTLGYVVQEIGRTRHAAEMGEAAAERSARMRQGIEALGGPGSPAARVLELQESTDPELADRTFEWGVRALLDGIRRAIP